MATLLLVLSFISWALVRSPVINEVLALRGVLMVLCYVFEFIVLLYYLPKKIIDKTYPNIKKSLIICTVLLVIFSTIALVISLYIPYAQKVLMQQSHADINQLLQRISQFYRFGVFAGFLSFCCYIYLWFGISKILSNKV
ncbi:hypothetical protein [Facilibium subflavum]|uniref:hypothetical protein n=1 Tax=Facilibium subflavum TaxID=2219058 RepID=UPI0013C31A21|nr:hypothetical protein [Facilibium subflavum]